MTNTSIMQNKRVTIKNHLQEIQLITRRTIIALIIMIILTVLLIVRLGYLQLAKQSMYATLSKKNWLDLVPAEPTRGLIYDRNGILLAENIPVFSLDVIPEKISNLPKALSEVAKIIPFSDNDIAQFQKQLKQRRRFDEIMLKLRLSEAEVAKFAENQYHFPGMLIKARLIRHYPLGPSFSHVLGYVGRINMEELNDIDSGNYSATNYIGKLGIEKFYEDELHGTVGYQQAENDASGEPIRILNQIKPIPGKNLFLTIDSKLQLAAEHALAGHRGAVIAIQPSTGQILAMVSEPSFDPNVFVAGISNRDFQTLQKSPDRPLFNRAIRGLYPLASTIKPYIALEGLDSGVADTEYTIFDPGWYQLPDRERIWRDWQRRGHGRVNLVKAITVSCDTYFFGLAHNLGIERIGSILSQFGFGQLTGVDLDGELPGIVATPAWKRQVKDASWYDGDTLNAGIGQGYMQATPLQLAAAVATLANRGVRFTPYLLLAEQEPGKPAVMQTSILAEPVKLQDKNTWNIVIGAMQQVVTSPQGTGFRFGKLAYTLAAKTGTAQVYSITHYDNEDEQENEENIPDRLRDHHLLVAFAPANKPQIAIAVVVENSSLAIRIAHNILDYYFLGPPPPQLQLQHTENDLNALQ